MWTADIVFGNEAEISTLVRTLKHAELHVIKSGDHSFKVKGGAQAQAPAFDEVIAAAVSWMRGTSG